MPPAGRGEAAGTKDMQKTVAGQAGRGQVAGGDR